MSFAEYLMQDRDFLQKRINEQDDYINSLPYRSLTIDRFLELLNSAVCQRIRFKIHLDRLENRRRGG